jgi:hypothetical protein
MLHIPALYTAIRSYMVLAICAFLLFQFGFRESSSTTEAIHARPPAWGSPLSGKEK